MTRLILLPSVLLIVLFTLLIGAAQFQPAADPSPQFEPCVLTAPCWQSIEIGVTSAQEAAAHLSAISGLERSQDQCILSGACVAYTWRISTTQALYAMMEVNHRLIAIVDRYDPGFTVGEALVALKLSSVEGADLDVDSPHQAHINLYFADHRLVLRAITACPGGYRALLDTPVRILELVSPEMSVVFPKPTLTYGAFYRAYNRACGTG